MWVNCIGAEFITAAFKFGERKEYLPSFVHFLGKTLNVVISRHRFAENGKISIKKMEFLPFSAKKASDELVSFQASLPGSY